MAVFALPSCLHAQQANSVAAPAVALNPARNLDTAAPADVIPDAPVPQVEVAQAAGAQTADSQTSDSQASDPQTSDPEAAQKTGQAPNASTAQGGSSSSQASSSSSAQQPSGQETQQQKAQEQLKEQEHQRVLGIVPAFNTSYRSDAVSLTAAQKLSLAFHSSIDPFTFAAAFLVTGYHEALDEDTGFGWGWEGFGKRSGAAYLDAVDGTMIGNGFLPALLHQDPRYFRLGHGTKTHRILYAMATNIMCKHDNTGKWEPNYSNVGGNIIAGALSNLYYPAQNSGWGQTISNGMIVTAEGGIGSLFQEFWPDISRKVLHKDPTHGLDAQMQAQDKAKQQNAQPADNQNPQPTQK
jgi:hypothetical protein